ncbi:ferredoxin reductase family protein [Xylanimonas sp. McL0601]|uniref:ferredoxin reductase family protein n=1 Tax=Xylanimonas sp. McL0601 TaxID=3414739 RepID=UPI003CF4F63F
MTSTLMSRSTPRRPATRKRSGSAWGPASAAVIWGTSVIVAALWLRGGGIQALFAGGGDALTTLGRATGLAASNLLLYQVLLMARVPVFERGLGRDKITRWHRLTGFWSFWLMLAHIALVVLGYAATGNAGWWAQTWDFVVSYPGMLLATAGTTALVAVVVLSIRAARRRLRYESWHLLHLYAYVGVGLALPHQLWTGADFLSSPLATVYWWTLWALAAGSVVVFRVAVPLARSAWHGLHVEAVVPDGDRGITVHLRGRHLHLLGAVAGQFFVFRFLDGPGWTRAHPFSLAQAPRRDRYAIAARIVGDGTERMAQMRPGTRVLVEGPYGRMTGAERTGRKLLMLGAGAGVAPLVALLQEQPWRRGEATIITRDHAPQDALLTDALEDLVTRRSLRWYRLDGARASRGPSWLPTQYSTWAGQDILREMAGPLHAYDVYLCGPDPWMAAVRKDLDAAGVRASRIHAESFSN